MNTDTLLIFACLALFIARSPVAASETALRVAILNDRVLGREAALLTVELSKQKDFAVIERAEAEKLFAEQKLALLFEPREVGSRIRAGESLKAGVLVLLKPNEETQTRFVDEKERRSHGGGPRAGRV
jgi:hypothetical protein